MAQYLSTNYPNAYLRGRVLYSGALKKYEGGEKRKVI
jgi:hypothetical protein